MARVGLNYSVILGIFLLVAQQALAVQHHMLIVSGIGGEEEYSKQFSEISMSIYESARELGLEKDSIVMLSAEPMVGGAHEYRKSTKHNIKKAIIEIGAKAQSSDRVFVILIGHGNARGDSAVLNIPGPDITAEELAEALKIFDDQGLIIINTASASGPFIRYLSSPNRVVITATSSGREYNAAIFGELFVSAFAESGADRDKDERISMLEAFDYARREVRRRYDNDKRLLTEHALLDDNGDGVGSLDPGEDKTDGSLARNIYLQQPNLVAAGAVSELAKLLQRKQEIEQSVNEFKKQRGILDNVEYYNQLEVLLISLALISREIRAQGG